MFEITQDILDVEAYEQAQQQPATLVKRNKLTWLVRDLPMDYVAEPGGRTDEWGWCREGDVVRIGLFPYCSRAVFPEVALGYAFELGFKARDYIEPKYVIKRLHITLGNPVTETDLNGQPVLRFWLGFAIGLREK